MTLTLHIQPGIGGSGRATLRADGLEVGVEYVFDLRCFAPGGKLDYEDRRVVLKKKADTFGVASWEGPMPVPAAYLGMVSGKGAVYTKTETVS